jgi:hypothetical protein
MAHNVLAYKAVEAGTRLRVSDTRQLKPSLRCAACWEIVPRTLAQRVHECAHCGHTAPRDQNAASVVLIDARTPGTGVAARLRPLARQRARSKSVTRETPLQRRKTLSSGGVHSGLWRNRDVQSLIERHFNIYHSNGYVRELVGKLGMSIGCGQQSGTQRRSLVP